MKTYLLTFTINGRRTEEIVRASTIGNAQRIILDKYSGNKINFIRTGHEYM